MKFRPMRRKAGLTVNACAYLLNVAPRTVRRWEDDNNAMEPPALAAAILKGFILGKVPKSWADWRGHGIGDIRSWRPIQFDGMAGTAAGVAIRRKHGPSAIALHWSARTDSKLVS